MTVDIHIEISFEVDGETKIGRLVRRVDPEIIDLNPEYLSEEYKLAKIHLEQAIAQIQDAARQPHPQPSQS